MGVLEHGCNSSGPLSSGASQASLIFNAMTRLPMVAGREHLLPPWFSRLHGRYKTTGAILFIGSLTIVALVAGSAGVGSQEAIQLISNAAVILYALTYADLDTSSPWQKPALFAVSIVGAVCDRAFFLE